MTRIATLAFAACMLAAPAAACDAPVCVVDPDSLNLPRVITFDDLPSSFGPGRQVETVLVQDGAQFGERFAGQVAMADGNFDRIKGEAAAPLTVLPGAPGQTLGVLRLMATSVLHGHGPAGFPKHEAAGEGAIAFVFDHDQSALALDIRGGEQGEAMLTFLARDGRRIHSLTLGPLSEQSYGFQRSDDLPDIAGVLIENADPEGIALDNIRFRDDLVIGMLLLPLQP